MVRIGQPRVAKSDRTMPRWRRTRRWHVAKVQRSGRGSCDRGRPAAAGPGARSGATAPSTAQVRLRGLHRPMAFDQFRHRELIADNEAEIRPVQSADPATAGGTDVRYHLRLDGSGSTGKSMRPLWACSTTPRSRRPSARPARAARSSWDTISLVHDDIEDDDGAPQPTDPWARMASSRRQTTGRLLFSLSGSRSTPDRPASRMRHCSA